MCILDLPNESELVLAVHWKTRNLQVAVGVNHTEGDASDHPATRQDSERKIE